MTKVYVVTDGDYSDYSIYGVYSTREKAEYAKKLFTCYNDIEEYELDDFKGAPIGMFFWSVEMDKEGNTSIITNRNPDYHKETDWHPKSQWDKNKTVVFYMWARDEKHAIKIANERRVQLIASDQWTTDMEEWRARRIE